jgi:succinate dehydrogenase / fumarate reductase membrane anchor subunit
MSLMNPLARARGHGSAKEGVQHWYLQRLTAVFLLFLVGWLVYSLVRLAGADHAAASAYLAHPVHASLMSLLIVTSLYHAMLGLQVVIEDYVHQPVLEIALLLLTRAAAFIGIALGLIHTLKLALGG